MACILFYWCWIGVASWCEVYTVYIRYIWKVLAHKIRAIGIILEYYLFDAWDIFLMNSQYLWFKNTINARSIINFHVTFCVSCISWIFRTISPIWTLKLQFFHPVTIPDAALGIFDRCFWSLPRFSFEDLCDISWGCWHGITSWDIVWCIYGCNFIGYTCHNTTPSASNSN